jgi:purine nucleoside phosphorylase
MTIGLIAGTGFEHFEALEVEDRLSLSTPWGDPSGPLLRGRLGEAPVLYLARHGKGHALAPHDINYRANIAALKEAGATAILAVYTVGGITAPTWQPGTLVIPHQLIDYTWGRAQSYSLEGDVIHVDFTEPYDAKLRAALCAAAAPVQAAAALPLVEEGVYAAVQGPRLETAAEVDRLERDGATIVGMTGMPEAGLARELDLPLAGLGLVVNPAAGRGQVSLPEIMAAAEAGRGRIMAVLADAVAALNAS